MTAPASSGERHVGWRSGRREVKEHCANEMPNWQYGYLFERR